MSTCKRDVVARDRDVWLSVWDKTETETSPCFAETETFEKYVSRPSRDRDVETETTTLVMHTDDSVNESINQSIRIFKSGKMNEDHYELQVKNTVQFSKSDNVVWMI